MPVVNVQRVSFSNLVDQKLHLAKPSIKPTQQTSDSSRRFLITVQASERILRNPWRQNKYFANGH